MDYKITIQDVTEQNKAEKLRQTVDRLAKAFKLPITYQAEHRQARGVRLSGTAGSV